MIVAENLVFDYPEKRALHGVSLTIERGAIVALVGPNGAGKTTLIRCLVALAEPVSGRVTMNGADVRDAPAAAHRNMGYLADFVGLYDALSVRRCLLHAAAASGMPATRHRDLVARAAERLDLNDHLDALAGQLSRGQRQRVAIAQSIIHEPEFLVLDEPAAGLDPEARHRLSALIVRLRDEGTTLLISSHILAELEDYCTDMVVIDGGRLVETDNPGAVRLRVHIRLAVPEPRLIERVSALSGVAAVTLIGDLEARVTLAAEAPPLHALLRDLVSIGLPIVEFGPERWDLQDSYMAAMGTRRADGEPGRES